MGIPETEPDFTDGMSRDDLAHGLHMAKAEIERLMRLDKDTVKILRSTQAKLESAEAVVETTKELVKEQVCSECDVPHGFVRNAHYCNEVKCQWRVITHFLSAHDKEKKDAKANL